ncbi:MAG: N-acetylmuramoyl-L-alanine amidase [Candidatus Binatales bacterium]
MIATAQAALAAPAVISAVSVERRGETLELHFRLMGAPQLRMTGRGNQLTIDLGHTRLTIPPRPLFGLESPPLSLLRAIEKPDGDSQLIIEVTGKTDYALAQPPGEILIRLAPAGKVSNLDAPLTVPRQSARQSRQSLQSLQSEPVIVAPAPTVTGDGLRHASIGSSVTERIAGPARVVIDPGHGGYDPGARDASGRFAEKDLALAIAILLARELEARGVSVAMTRETDTFLSLPERTRLADRDDADLFVSVHLNSSPNPRTSGIEVYYLNNTTDRAALRLARLENDAGNGNGASNGYGAQGGPNLNYILSDLRQNYKAGESASLARMIDSQTVAELNRAFELGVNPLGAKMGPFYVLVGAHMPAVLVECGFLSNPVEAARLAAPAYQERIADGIAAAVVHYLNADLASGNL